jgi:hypothetical protein
MPSRIRKLKVATPEPFPTRPPTRQPAKLKLQQQQTAPAFTVRKRGESARMRTGF